MSIEDQAKRAYKVGRRVNAGPSELACVLRRAEGGGIKISQSNLTDAERHRLFVHFGTAQTARMGGLEKGVHVTRRTVAQPGTPMHFMFCLDALPPPFTVIA